MDDDRCQKCRMPAETCLAAQREKLMPCCDQCRHDLMAAMRPEIEEAARVRDRE